MANIPEKQLTAVVTLIPGLKSPTVMSLAEKGMVAVHAVVDEDHINALVPQLKKAGATGILVLRSRGWFRDPGHELTPEIRAKYVSRRGALSGVVGTVVDQILADFRKIRRHDPRADEEVRQVDLANFAVSAEEVAAAEERLPQNVQVAIRTMYDSVVRFHKQDLVKSFEIQPIKGVSLGKQIVPFDRAGLYVPGGLAVYPSSVIMAAAPAVVAA